LDGCDRVFWMLVVEGGLGGFRGVWVGLGWVVSKISKNLFVMGYGVVV